MATDLQRAIANLCGADVAGLSERSAAARLRLALAGDLLGIHPEKPATEQQVEIARQLGIKGLSNWREIAALQIEAEFVQMNELAMEKHNFKAGMRVRFIGGPTVYGHAYEVGSEFLVSTVKADGRIYLKQTNGASAYASQLEPVT